MFNKKIKFFELILFMCLLFTSFACKNNSTSPTDEYGYVPLLEKDVEYIQDASKQVKNIILILGDGMGANQVKVTEMVIGENRSLDLRKLTSVGQIKTSCLDNYVTDSAAAATAYATGVKTVYERAGKDKDGNDLKTILDYCHENGKMTAVVTDKALSDATPLAFTAHLNNRYKEPLTIAPQQIKSNVDIMLGSGANKFKANQSLMEEYGYDFVETKEALMNLKSNKYIGAFSNLNKMIEASIYPTLPEMAQKALSTLKTCDKGFFLFVESGQIDNYCGDGNIQKMAEKVVTLDRVLRISMNFAKENPDTLIIVLADHETGGLVIKDGTPDKTWFTEETRYHTPVNVPVYSYGMNSNEFNGKTIENTEVFDIMFRLMGFQK